MSALRRCAAGKCLCCDTASLTIETTVVSPFLAHRAWGGAPELTAIAFCPECGFRFFDRGLTMEEADSYYRNYRNDHYFYDRNRFEPFYTRSIHREIAAWLTSPWRGSALREALDNAGAPFRFTKIMDYGGSDGGVIASIDADHKAVFDPSGSATIPGIESIENETEIGRSWDLITSCQVFEHLPDPMASLLKLRQALTTDGWLYIEVPNEIWKNHSAHGQSRDILLRWLVKHPRILIAADTLSTACRIKLGILPPLGFIPMREHLNYFTLNALKALLLKAKFTLVASGVNTTGQIYAIARIPYI